MRYYHVAGDHYRPGDDLRPWDELVAEGLVSEDDWHWESEYGTDSDVVCLYETLDEAQHHQDTYGGMILAVDLDVEDGIAVIDNREVRMLRVSEGYPAIPARIPAEYITVA